MLTPEDLESLPENLVWLFQDMEDYVLEDVSRRIGKAGSLTATAQQQIDTLLDLGMSPVELEKVIASYSKEAQAELRKTFDDALSRSVNADNALYSAAGKGTMASPALSAILEQAILQTGGELRNMTGSLGFSIMQNGKPVFKSIMDAYQTELDKALAKVTTGLADPRTAVRTAVKELADSGLTWVDYASGARNRLDVAVERAVRTGANQMALRGTDALMQKMGAEYVEVTAHEGARESHAVWQGKVFHVGGSKEEYPDFVTSTGYGTGEGLGGWNCRHSFFPFFPGISVRTYTDEQLRNLDNPPFEWNGKTYTHYDATQKQRAYERAMRTQKREIVAYEAAGDVVAQDLQNARIKLKMIEREYIQFSQASGIRVKFDRAQSLGYGRSSAQKAV